MKTVHNVMQGVILYVQAPINNQNAVHLGNGNAKVIRIISAPNQVCKNIIKDLYAHNGIV